MTTQEQAQHCECGRATGEYCNWHGSRSDMVVVEWMPEYLRASHEAAGGTGTYPHDGSVRFLCEKSCAERLAETEDPDYFRITRVNPARFSAE